MCTVQSEYIHYVEGFLLTPGYIDLSALRFYAVSESVESDDDVYHVDLDDDTAEAMDDDDDEDDGGNRRLDKDDYKMEGSAVDIAVFRLVSMN